MAATAAPGRREAQGARRLIVNADDFGQSEGINDGIIQCHEQGVVTSASLMVRWPDAASAVAYARAHPRLGVGLHIDLGEWVYRDRQWRQLYSVTDISNAAAVRVEIFHQLETFQRVMDSNPTHLDSHQHVHRSGPVEEIVAEIGASLDIPVRGGRRGIRYVGSFYGQGAKGQALVEQIAVERLAAILRSLPAGATELGCHPGLRGDAGGMYVAEREREVVVLCDPGIRTVVESESIELISFRDVDSFQF